MNEKIYLGLDIGTTNISAVVYDAAKETILSTYIAPNVSRLNTADDLAEFDVTKILAQAKQIIDDALFAHPQTCAIGLTGQMHGVVYISEAGKPVSPLYNWQDGRGNREYAPGRTYCDEILARTGYLCHTGYGCATLFYNRENGLEPPDAHCFCTVMDCLGLELTGRKQPLIHTSNAASLGLYRMEQSRFDEAALHKLGLSHLALPQVTVSAQMLGTYRKIPVCVAIGDNQASFFGSVRGREYALVNFGTGSQISVAVDRYLMPPEGIEIRPYLFGDYLLCGSALCGGKAYAVLEQFFRSYAESLTDNPSSQYAIMNALAEAAYREGTPLSISTLFCGTRQDPSLRGTVVGISDTNFTPGNMILGVLQGMTDELKNYFDAMDHRHITALAASGGGVKKNPVLQKLLEDTFGMPLTLTACNEEAALGCALFAAMGGADL